MTPPTTGVPDTAQRRAQRRARLTDALRLLPFLGVLLFLLPDLVLSGGAATTDATAPWLIYLFAGWFLLVVLAAGLGHLHVRAERAASTPPES